VTGVAFAQAEGGTQTAPLGVAAVLAPLAAAALGIERILEAGWGIVEIILARLPKYAFLKKKDADLTDEDRSNQANHSQFKVWASVVAGIVVGLLVALSANLAMFEMIGLSNVTHLADVLITGVVIGSGSKFTHDVIGIFTQTKKLVENWAELADVRKNKELEKK